jgi:hypothetical protein
MVTDARVEPTRPTSVVKATNAIAVPRQPTATASTLDHAKGESGTTVNPKGATSASATSCARQMTGSAPWRRSRVGTPDLDTYEAFVTAGLGAAPGIAKVDSHLTMKVVKSPWSGSAAREHLRQLDAAPGVRRPFAPHQLRHAHAVEMAREGVPLNVIQRQLGHADLCVTSVYLQGIDNTEVISTIHARRAPTMPASAGLLM